ncbi:isopenicillin N synthase family dioxygenase [Paludibaculum fermentans]|uniref:isopenicillin N synthase family dioxygenase n=1 Tax=Paludibaculum fermentans TaxID=1473598 RepID=UPI003EBAAD40
MAARSIVTVPVFDFSGPMDASEIARLSQAAAGVGFFHVRHPLFDEQRGNQAIELARDFFALPPADKQSLAIENSAHFRGYSEMRNARDWREQIHFGREEPAGVHPLSGPNLWPASREWRAELLRLIADFETAGRDILNAISAGLPLRPDQLLPPAEAPYVLLKLIHYLPPPDGQPRSGVAPHVDFSWITLLLQDDAGGLSACTPEGQWQDIKPMPGTLIVNIGEILQFVTGARLRATPHRVMNRTRDRISLPFFLNPGLDRWIEPARLGQQDPSTATPDPEHVHRVLPVNAATTFHYGEAEWRRKGQGVWCRDCVKA